MSCIPASHSMSTILSQVESQMEDSPGQRRGSKAYQIFPEANMDEDGDSSSYPEDFLYKRERLPSIVVEPTECNEPENGELRWPPRSLLGHNVEEEEEEEDSSVDHTDSSMDAEQQEDMGMEEGSIARKSSIGPSQSQLSLSRLTPPASPTPPEAAPPCLRS
ncbi:protein LBH-like isoform X1 [Epinephelus fuscoguttatus]|uniref:protein LBH-like isoform X1 n=1 Tax=Epinephelus fuscoguttatus TaxID=293821 RepID=UPI0020D137A9|nr:protein LBH-like isoform X1 [Epinephelus fuscoguttatus]